MPLPQEPEDFGHKKLVRREGHDPALSSTVRVNHAETNELHCDGGIQLEEQPATLHEGRELEGREIQQKASQPCENGEHRQHGGDEPLDPRLDPDRNPDPFTRWVGKHTLADVLVEGEPVTALLDLGAQSNLITPALVRKLGLKVGPLHHLVEGKFHLTGVGNIFVNQILGYTVLSLEVPGVKGYKEDHVALIVPDDSKFAQQVPLILGTAATERISPIAKESEVVDLEWAWRETRFNELLAARRTAVKQGLLACLGNVRVYSGQITAPRRLNPGPAPEQIHPNRILRTKQAIDVPPFSAHVVPAVTRVMPKATGDVIKVLVEPIPCSDTTLHPAVRVQPCYNEIPNGGKTVPVFIVNRTGKDQKIPRGTPVAYVAEITHLAEASELKPSHPPEGSTKPQQTHEERLKKVFELLDLTHLQSWPEAEKKKAMDLMAEYADIFALHELELGETKGTTHRINVTDEVPFKERYRHIPRHQMDEVRHMVEEMLRIGVIKESKSPWCNAVVLARKKNGELRLCIDFRRLNQRTVKDSYPLPRIKEALDNIKGARFFTSLDLKQGFWEVPMDEDSKQYTAFTVGPLGFYEFERMPFGLCNAPATFQRLMEACLGELVLEACLIYVDDIIIFSETENAHLARLRAVFDRIRAFGLKMRPHKCTFFAPEVDYLGHHISGDGIRPDDRHIARVKEFVPPTTVTEVRRFLGFVNHYRRFIQGYSKIARPLQQYTAGELSKEKDTAVKLSPEAVQAFEKLRDACITAPVLAFADYEKPFILETDASKEALGAVLYQKQTDGTTRPVAFGSRTTNAAEKNYHSSKLEFLALKWAVSDEFKDYLILQPFEVRTDNNPLTYIFTSPHLDAVGHRWVQQLAGFNFTLKYIKGRNNGAADGMSRIKRTLTQEETKTILGASVMPPGERAETKRPEVVELMQELESEAERDGIPFCGGESHPGDPDLALSTRVIAPIRIQAPEWRVEQFNDPVLAAVKDWIVAQKASESPKDYPRDLLRTALRQHLSEEDSEAYLRQLPRLKMTNGLLYRMGDKQLDDDHAPQFVVPTAYRKRAIDGCHRDAGHQGQNRTISLLQDRFWWPGMVTQARDAVKDCARCIQATAPYESAKLCPILVTHPMELVHVDVVHIEKSPTALKAGTVKVLVVTDHFTRFTRAFVIKNERARTVADTLWKGFFSVFGVPGRLISDQGRNFESTLIAELCKILDVEKVRTSPYHPQGNGQVERANQTIIRMLKKLTAKEKERWHLHLPSVTHAYNCTRSAVTGFSPYYLMFGTRPRIPVDVFFPTARAGVKEKNYTRYVKQLRSHLREAFDAAAAANANEAGRQKRYYDSKIRGVVLEEGDVVQLAVAAKHDRRKIGDRWGDHLYEVRSVDPDIPVLEIQRLDGTGSAFKVHRNRLRLLRQGTTFSSSRNLEVWIEPRCDGDSDCQTSMEQADSEERGSLAASAAAVDTPGIVSTRVEVHQPPTEVIVQWELAPQIEPVETVAAWTHGQENMEATTALGRGTVEEIS